MYFNSYKSISRFLMGSGLACTLFFAACGGDSSSTEPNQPESSDSEETIESSGANDDKSSSSVKESKTGSSSSEATTPSGVKQYYIENFDGNEILTLANAKWDFYKQKNTSADYKIITDPQNKENHIAAITKISGTDWAKNDKSFEFGKSSIEYSFEVKSSFKAYDLSKCKEISYRYKGAAHSFNIETTKNIWADGTQFKVSVEDAEDWTTKVIELTKLKSPEGDTLDRRDVQGLMFHIATKPAISYLYIDDISCDGEITYGQKDLDLSMFHIFEDFDGNGVVSQANLEWKLYVEKKTSAQYRPSSNSKKGNHFAIIDKIEGSNWAKKESDFEYGMSSVEFSVAVNDVRSQTIDFSFCNDLFYRYKGAAHSINIETTKNTWADGTQFKVSFEDAEDWTTKVIELTKLKSPEGDTLDRKNVQGLMFHIATKPAISYLYIDDITCDGGMIFKEAELSSSSQAKSSSSEEVSSSSQAESSSSLAKSSSSLDVKYSTITDSRDGAKYKTAEVGDYIWMTEDLKFDNTLYLFDDRSITTYKVTLINDQVWMAENLNLDFDKDMNDLGICYDNKSENCDKYGRLYTHSEALEACPEGWHVPTTKEWNHLISIAGGANTAGANLKSTSGWEWWKNDPNPGNGNGTDKYGFNALPAGYKLSSGFVYQGIKTRFWLQEMVEGSTTSANMAHTQSFGIEINSNGDTVSAYAYGRADIGNEFITSAHSVRCIKDDANLGDSRKCTGSDTDKCKNGALYNWAGAKDTVNSLCGINNKCTAAFDICPAGFKLPDTTAWNQLLETVGGIDAAEALLTSSSKTTSFWTSTQNSNSDAWTFTIDPEASKSLVSAQKKTYNAIRCYKDKTEIEVN